MLRVLLSLMLAFVSFCHADAFESGDRIYIDPSSFDADTEGDQFYIHTGHNIWLVTHTINRDAKGMFAYQCNLVKAPDGPGSIGKYAKAWRCPYCNHYWPVGQPCGNPDCPSRY
jgi:hypothetical protein